MQKSLTQRLFEHRLGLLVCLTAAGIEPDLRSSTTDWLHEVVAGMNLDNFLVRPHREQVEEWSDRSRWGAVTKDDGAEILNHLAGLPSAVHDPDLDAKRFDLLVLRRQLAQLELLDAVAGDEWWVDVTLPMLEVMRLRLRGLVRFVERTRQNPVYTDLEDTLDTLEPVDLPQVATGMNWDRFRAKAQAYLRQHTDHLALQKLRRNKQLTAADLDALADLLVASASPLTEPGSSSVPVSSARSSARSSASTVPWLLISSPPTSTTPSSRSLRSGSSARSSTS